MPLRRPLGSWIAAFAALACVWMSAQDSRGTSRPVEDTAEIAAARTNAAETAELTGPDSLAYGIALKDLAGLLKGADRLEDAIVEARRALAIIERDDGGQRTNLAVIRLTLAVCLHDAGRLAEAIPVARAATEDWLAARGPDHRDTSKSFLVLGGILSLAGLHEDSEQALRRALAASELPPLERVAILHGLANVLIALGKNSQARVTLEEAGTIIAAERRAPPMLRARQEFLLGTFELTIHRPDDARVHMEHHLEILRALPRVSDVDLSVGLHQLSQAYVAEGRLEEGRRALDEALAAFARTQGDSRVASAFVDAAMLALRLRDPGRAIEYAEKCLAFLRDHGIEQASKAKALRWLGVAKHASGKPEEALPAFDDAIAAGRRIRGPAGDQLVAGALGGKGRALAALGRSTEARAAFRAAMAAAVSALEERVAMLSEAERLSLVDDAREVLDLFLSSAADDPAEATAIASEIFAWKGQILRAVQVERALLRAREGPEISALRSRLAGVQTRLASAVRHRSARTTIAELIAEREEIERSLARLAAASRPVPASPKDVANALGDDEALVDYLAYGRFDPADPYGNRKPDGERLLAVVYRKGVAPRVIQVGSAVAMHEALEIHLRITARDLRADPAADALVRAAGSAVRTAVWSPIEPALAGARRVFVVPDGSLAGLPFETLPSADGGRLLVEDLEIAYLLAVQDRLVVNERRSGASALLVGAVDYGEARSPDSREVAPDPLGLPLSALPHTGAEIDGVERAIAGPEASAAQVVRLAGRDASEARVKSAMAGKRIVHLATHGIFQRDSDFAGTQRSRRPTAFEGSLPSLRSGVALAGINAGGGSGDDGVLTAGEVAWCDLSACDLAVISSCESGLGIPRGGESLLGLRRSLRLAGARSTVTALWRVEDQAAAVLMRAFYDGIFQKGLSKVAALREAKLQALKAARDAGAPRGNPATWAAFVLEGDWK